MPCACQKPVPNYPENVEWGPLMWSIFHALAERAGTQPTPVLQDDERRQWLLLLKFTPDSLPCDKCRIHYTEWVKKRSPDTLKTLPYADMREWIRTWLFDLHNEVNARNQKPLFDYSALKETYKAVNIKETWQRLEPVIKVAIQLNGISLMPWRKWLGSVRSLQGLYGI